MMNVFKVSAISHCDSEKVVRRLFTTAINYSNFRTWYKISPFLLGLVLNIWVEVDRLTESIFYVTHNSDAAPDKRRITSRTFVLIKPPSFFVASARSCGFRPRNNATADPFQSVSGYFGPERLRWSEITDMEATIGVVMSVVKIKKR